MLSSPVRRPETPRTGTPVQGLRVGVLAEVGGATGRAIARGVARASEQSSDTRCELLPISLDPIAEDLQGFDAFIAESLPGWLRPLAAKKPVVVIDELFHPEGVHSIVMDHEAAGIAAARILRETPADHFAFVQKADLTDQEKVRASLRARGFATGVQRIAPGIETEAATPGIEIWKCHDSTDLAQELSRAPTPLGVLACDDAVAVDVLHACARLGLRVPEDVAVVGIDNDQLVCNLTRPRLTSIDSGYTLLAGEAMRLVERLVLGESVDGIRFKMPLGITALRESTGHTCVDDPVVNHALEHIRRWAHESLSVEEVATACGMSRRSLEMRFREHLGSTVSSEIAEVQHKLARRLLRLTRLSTEQIGSAFGLTARSFRRRFHQLEGISPTAFRADSSRDTRRGSMPGGKRPRARFSVGIIGFPSWGSVQAILRGAALYAHTAPDLEVSLATPDDDSHDGFLVASNAPEVNAAVEANIPRDKPIAFLDQNHFGPRSFSVLGDNADYGALAAAHFLGKGYRNLAFFHHLGNEANQPRSADSDFRMSERLRGFVERARLDGIAPSEIPVLGSTNDDEAQAWLRSLPKPVGILCFNDFWAMHLVHNCRVAGIRVPGEVAVMGVDDYSLLCRLSGISLTSVRIGFVRAGDRALAMLHGVLAGSPIPRTPSPIPACAVIERQSTRGYACSDPLLQRAGEYMVANLPRKLTVPQIAEAIGSHPRTLESHYQKFLRRGVHEELQRLRIDHACRLLATTSLTVKEVGARVGFPHSQSLCRAFSQATGLTPLGYRRHRADLLTE